MRLEFDEEEQLQEEGQEEEAPRRRDSELALGSATLLVLLSVLVLICGLCFGVGYSVGHRAGEEKAAQVAAFTPPALQGDPSRPKPPATGGNNYLPVANPIPAPFAPSGWRMNTVEGAGSAEAASRPVAAPAKGAEQAQGRAAVPAQTAGAAGGGAGAKAQATPTPVAPTPVAPPTPAVKEAAPPPPPPPPAPPKPPTPQVVQVAAVANPEDGQVLVTALRKRGYSVTVRREDSDGLIHVRIGPFANPTEAAAMRQKLMNDGYNAVLQAQ